MALVDRAHPPRPPDWLPGIEFAGFVGGSADWLFAMDTDSAAVWTTHLTYAVATGGQPPSSWECPGGLIAAPSRGWRWRHRPSAAGAAVVAARKARWGNREGRGHTQRAPPDGRHRAAASRAPGCRAAGSCQQGAGAGALWRRGSVYVMGSDGLFRTLLLSDGTMTAPMVRFLPPSARPSSLTFINGVIYTSTSYGCAPCPTASGPRSDGPQQGHHLAHRRPQSREAPARPSARTAPSTSRRRRTLRRRRAATRTASSRSTGRRFSRRTG